MATCVTCGDKLHPERAEKYGYCTKSACQNANRKGLTMVAVGVNKSAEQYQILDEVTRDDLAHGKHHDPRRATYGPVARPVPTPTNEDVERRRAPAATSSPTAPTAKSAAPRDRQATSPRPRHPWTASQQRLALLYNEQGLAPDEIAKKLGLSRYQVTQMILKAPRKRR